jgi:hypothetical protein
VADAVGDGRRGPARPHCQLLSRTLGGGSAPWAGGSQWWPARTQVGSVRSVRVARARPWGCGEVAELAKCAVAAAEEGQHGQVELGTCVVSADALDAQEPARRVGCLGAAAQDRVGGLVVPVVEYIAEQVGISSRWQGFEEAAGASLRAVAQVVGSEGAASFAVGSRVWGVQRPRRSTPGCWSSSPGSDRWPGQRS